MRLALRLTLLPAAALLAGGCGGGGGGSAQSTHYDLPSIRVCLQGQGLHTRSDVNTRFPGTQGNVVFNSEGQTVNVVAENEENEVGSDFKDIKDYLKSVGGSPDDVKRRGNVIYYPLGAGGFPDDSQAKVEKCLS